MKIYTSQDAIQEPENEKGAVVAIGNFDGVHKGHQELIARARTHAARLKRPLAVLTFSPHPREIFAPEAAPFRLTGDDQKARLFQDLCGVDILYTLPFTKAFASISAKDFIDNILVKAIGTTHIVVGHDFCFGNNREGNAETLAAHPAFDTEIVEALIHDEGTLYSSSEIRNALRRGDLKTANTLLGWDWTIQGEVIHGDKRGRELGYPTANMRLGTIITPATGVYATRVLIEGETDWRAAATNIGYRPMFKTEEPLVETYIFDFDQDIYGKQIIVQPVQFLRGEAKFESLDALTSQMAKDCAQAKKILA